MWLSGLILNRFTADGEIDDAKWCELILSSTRLVGTIIVKLDKVKPRIHSRISTHTNTHIHTPDRCTFTPMTFTYTNTPLNTVTLWETEKTSSPLNNTPLPPTPTKACPRTRVTVRVGWGVCAEETVPPGVGVTVLWISLLFAQSTAPSSNLGPFCCPLGLISPA